HEDALAAPVSQPRKGGFVRHAARQTERVGDGGVVGVVRDEAATSERGAEARVVDGDDRAQAGRFVELEVDLAEVVSPQLFEETHAVVVTWVIDTELGAFRLVSRLARGGMGEVWRGEHAASGAPVAVKLVVRH